MVTNVSDTARWVAFYRAIESARPDALFKDPYAERLAGERGRAMAANAPRQAQSGWAEVVRTRIVDDLIVTSVSEGCDRILNLAAGLDTRPYRMDLPASLEWVEADLGPIMDAKEKLLEGETPHCRMRRERIDLRDLPARDALMDGATTGAERALVITEGFLHYLDGDAVHAFARDLAERPNVRWWVLDVLSGAILRKSRRVMGSYLENAPLKFAPPDGVAFFERLGFRAREIRSVFREAARYGRAPLRRRLSALLPAPNPRALGTRWSGVVRLERTAV